MNSPQQELIISSFISSNQILIQVFKCIFQSEVPIVNLKLHPRAIGLQSFEEFWGEVFSVKSFLHWFRELI